MMKLISPLPNLPYPLFAKEGDYLGGLLTASGRICRKFINEKHINPN